jgi:hypothetical protein
MAAVISPLLSVCSSSCRSLGNAASHSPTASLSSELSVAMSVVPICHRPSSFFFGAAAGGEGVERLGGFSRSQLGRWSTEIQRLNGQQEAIRARIRRRTGSATANYGIKEYGTPVPPYNDPPQVKQSSNVETPLGEGAREGPKFWDYGTPSSFRDYTSPKGYGAQNYGIPAYSALTASARVATVEGLEPAQGKELEIINAEPKELEPELGGGDGGQGKEGGRGGGGGGGDGSGEGEESEPQKPMSTSQKLTLAYAALVGGEPSSLAQTFTNC